MAREDPQLKLRLTDEMKERVTTAARDNNRSVNAEIVSRLESSFLSPVVIPDELARRVGFYASEHGRTLSEEVVRVLEQKFPVPRSPDERFSEVLSILAGLKGGAETDSTLSKFSTEVLRTLRAISNGDMKADPATRERVSSALESWDESMYYQSLEAATVNMDPEELEKFERTGDDTIIVDPVFKEDEK